MSWKMISQYFSDSSAAALVRITINIVAWPYPFMRTQLPITPKATFMFRQRMTRRKAGMLAAGMELLTKLAD